MFGIMKKSTTLLIKVKIHQTCIDSCIKCVQMCKESLTLCLQETDVKERTNCLKALQDCSEVCTIAVNYMNRSSVNIEEICDVCDIICVHCATECGKFQDQHYQTCADTCKLCAIECRSRGVMNNLSNKNW